MKIQMLTLYAGPQGVMSAGQTYEVESALAAALVNGHYAVQVDKPVIVRIPAVKIETAVVSTETIETEAKPAPQKRRGK